MVVISEKNIHCHYFEVPKKLIEGEQRTQWDRGYIYSYSHDWINYNWVAFSVEVTKMGSHTFWIFGVGKFWQIGI